MQLQVAYLSDEFNITEVAENEREVFPTTASIRKTVLERKSECGG